MMDVKKTLLQGLLLTVLLVSGVAVAQEFFYEPSDAQAPNMITGQDVFNVGPSNQAKTGIIKARGIASDSAASGGQLCIGASCINSWAGTGGPADCRLETAQITDRSTSVGFNVDTIDTDTDPNPSFPNLYTSNCDALLSASSVSAGWVATGHDYTTRVLSSDGQTPRVCRYMRLVCDSNVTVLAPTVIATADFPVAGFADVTAVYQCSDLVDNDSDGLVDYQVDSDCVGWTDNTESPAFQCGDGIDNDGDTYIDYPADVGCTGTTDNTENSVSYQCSDGVDNDGDTLIDYPSDTGCTGMTDNTEAAVIYACSDGLDNDGDWLYDFPDDCQCASTSDNSETGITRPGCDDGGGGGGGTL